MILPPAPKRHFITVMLRPTRRNDPPRPARIYTDHISWMEETRKGNTCVWLASGGGITIAASLHEVATAESGHVFAQPA